jgi:hypothetical protein
LLSPGCAMGSILIPIPHLACPSLLRIMGRNGSRPNFSLYFKKDVYILNFVVLDRKKRQFLENKLSQ